MNKQLELIYLRQICEDLYTNEPLLFNRIQQATQIPDSKLIDGLEEVLRFLSLVYITNKRLTPSYLVDLIWHEFILFTRLYSDLCQSLFQRYIHHHPGGSDNENKKQFQLTIESYNKYYGKPNPFFWKGRYDIAIESDCGSCQSI